MSVDPDGYETPKPLCTELLKEHKGGSSSGCLILAFGILLILVSVISVVTVGLR